MFQTTRWSLILAARDPGADSRAALQELCETYRQPVLVFVRRHVRSIEEAEDLTQAFFLKFLEQRYHEAADPARGRFRTFLYVALKRFMAKAHTSACAAKRGGGVPATALDEELAGNLKDEPQQAPDREFERAWAMTVLGNALLRLRAEAQAAGKAELFARLEEFLIEPPEPARYAAVATRLGMRRNTVAVTVKRMRTRLTELIRRELSETVRDPADVDNELRALRDALAGA